MAQREDTQAVVGALLQRIGEGDPAKIAEMYAESVIWKLGWPADEYGATVPWIRHRTTRADVEDHYCTVAEHHVPGETTANIHTVLVDGPDAAIIGVLGQTLRATGVNYQTEFILYVTVADGLITRHHIIEDNLAVKRAFGAVGQREVLSSASR